MDALLHRESEFTLLREAIAELASGRPTVVSVEGGRGMGKSALLEAVVALLPRQTLVLRARCHPSESAYEYGMVRQLFDPVLGGHGDAAALDETPGAGGRRTHDVLLGLLRTARSLTSDRPLALLIDDLPHADAPSLRWFSYLARRLDHLPVLMVATTLPAPCPASGLTDLADLGQLPYLRRVRPGPLCPTCAGDLAERAFDAPVDRELVALCHLLSRGNPGVLREVIARLRREGLSPGAPDPAQALAIGADALAATALAWLAEDDPEAAELLTQLAVLGPDPDIAVCGALSRRGEVRIGRAREALIRGGLLVPGPPARFPHPALVPAVLARVPAQDRLDLHERAAVVLPRLGAPATDAAEHMLQAGCDWGLDVLCDAGAQAADAGDYEAAARYLRRARALADGPVRVSGPVGVSGPVRVSGGDGSGEGSGTSGLERGDTSVPGPEARTRAAETFLELTILLGTVELRHDLEACARHAVALADCAPDLTRRAEGLARLASPALAATTEGSRPFVRVAGELAALPAPPRELLLRLSAQALLSGHRSGLWPAARLAARGPLDDSVRAFSGALAAVAAAAGRTRAARRLAMRALPDTEQPGVARTAAGDVGRVGAAFALTWSGELEQAHALAGLLVNRARTDDGAATLPLGLLVRAEVAHRRGDFTSALADARDALSQADRLVSAALGCAAGAAAARALVALGRPGEAAALLDGRPAPEGAHPLVTALALQARGVVAAARGNHTEAVGLFLDCGHRLALRGITNPACLPWRAPAARAYAALGEHAAAMTIMSGEPLEAGRRTAPTAVPAPEHGRELLTPAEHRVVDLVVRGHSSLGVAERLFLSKRTVDTHLGRIYRKLGIRSRHELIAAMGLEQTS